MLRGMPDASEPKSPSKKRVALITSIVVLATIGACMVAIAAPKFGGFRARRPPQREALTPAPDPVAAPPSTDAGAP